MHDLIIVGGGLAGACATTYLCRTCSVLLLEAGDLASGASGAAAGLVNPLLSRRARPIWHMEDALHALHQVLDLTGTRSLFSEKGILRPAADAQQAAWFQEAANRHPQEARWLPTEAVRDAYPSIQAPLGALIVTSGGAIAVPEWIRRLVETAQRYGMDVRTHTEVTGWGESTSHAWVDVKLEGHAERLLARRVLLAVGASYPHFPELLSLRLHRVKGQVVRVARPANLNREDLPHLAGTGYVVHEDDSFLVGSSYEHDFANEAASREQSLQILAKANLMLPGIRDATILEESAGVRVNVPGTRLPMIGPLPGRERVWLLTGLGSKGLLMAPLLASQLERFFADPVRIPPEIQVGVRDRRMKV